MLFSRYGSQAGGHMVRVMRLNSGYWASTGYWCVGRTTIVGRVLAQPSDSVWLQRSRTSLTLDDNKARTLQHGLTTAVWRDQTYSSATTTAYSFNNDWHTYYIYDLPNGSSCYMSVDGTSVHGFSISNAMTQDTGTEYSLWIFGNGGITMDIKSMIVKDLAGATKYSWDFESGDDVPDGWVNADIRKVAA